MVVEVDDDCPEPIFALTVKNTAGTEIYGTNTLFSKQPAPTMKAGEQHEVDFTFDLDLMPGHYFFLIWVHPFRPAKNWSCCNDATTPSTSRSMALTGPLASRTSMRPSPRDR